MSGVQVITKRLNQLPTNYAFFGISGYYIKLLLATGVGWAMDSMDTFVFIFCVGFIAKDIPMTPHEQGILASSVFAGSLVGSFLFGNLADSYGRRPMFMVTMLVFLVGLACCAVVSNYYLLVLFRFISGVGLGGELPVASTLVQELCPQATRGRIIVILESFWAIGCMFAVVLAFEATKTLGWRGTFGICCIPVVYSVAVRFVIPESPKWLASVGRMQEAEEVVTKIESAHNVAYSKQDQMEEQVVDNSIDKAISRMSTLQRIGLLFAGKYLVRTIVLWTVWFGITFSYYAIYIWLPSIVSTTGFNINGSTSTMLTIVAFQLPGYFAAAFVVEVIGRKMTLVVFLLGAFGSSIAFSYVEPTQGPLMVTGSLMSFFMLGAWGSLYAYTPENYPTSIRAMGAAYPAGFSRIAAIAGPYIVPIMVNNKMSISSIMWVFGGVLAFISIVLLVFGFETRGIDADSETLDTKSSSNKEVITP